MDTPFQPSIPPEEPLSDAEANFLDESPPGFFPENQDSNVGLLRKLFSDKTQEAADQLTTIYSELFVESAVTFLEDWEYELGLPVAPAGLQTLDRRTRLLGRVRKGPFTRTRRAKIVEEYIQATFGATLTFGPSGLTIGAGLTLHDESGDVASLYDITENISGFSYTVTIDTSITVDLAGLTRELDRITPAHINYSIVSAAVPNALTKAGSDSAAGTDSSSKIVKITASDSGAGFDSSGATFKQGTDAGTDSENAIILATTPGGSDTGISTQSGAIVGRPNTTDTGTGADTGTGGAITGAFGEGLFGDGTFGGTTAVVDVTRRGGAGNTDGGSASASVVVNVPTNVAGDLLLVAIVVADQTAGLNIPAPAGFTLEGSRLSTLDGGQSIFIFSKISSGSEPATWTFTIGGGTPASFQWNNYAASYYDVGTGATLALRNLTLADVPKVGGVYTSPTVTPTIDNAIVVSVFGVDEATAPPYSLAPTAPAVEIYDAMETGTNLVMGYYEEKQSTAAAATHVVTPTGGRGGVVAIGVIKD